MYNVKGVLEIYSFYCVVICQLQLHFGGQKIVGHLDCYFWHFYR